MFDQIDTAGIADRGIVPALPLALLGLPAGALLLICP
jgi:hypothetical protein